MNISKKQIAYFYFILFFCLSIFNSKFISDKSLNNLDTSNTIILDEAKLTYYVSSSGKSKEGLSSSDPMNYETLKNKKFNSGDKLLFKTGDTFYGTFEPFINNVDNATFTVSSYGDEALGLPTISGYKIVKKDSSWEKSDNNIYKINLTDFSKYDGLKKTDVNTNKIGFLEDKNKNKYYNLKFSLDDVKNDYDFYCDGTFLYIKTKGKSPYKELGELKLSSRIMLVIPKSNMKIENLHIIGTGAHGMDNNLPDLENIEICNNIIEDIGGSCLKDTTRYGNGIQFYETNIKNLNIHHNILRNIYDVGFTIQGSKGSGLNISVKSNIFCLNSQDSEIWQNSKATGVYNYVFEDNISYLQGRGWGYYARTDKYAAGHILFWGYKINNLVERTKIYFTKNYVYNPRKIYYIANQQNTSITFKTTDCIRADYNNYFMNNDTIIYQLEYNYSQRETYIKECNKDHHTKFVLLDSINEDIVSKATNSSNFKELRAFFATDSKEEESGNGLTIFLVVLIILIVLIVAGSLVYVFYFRRKKNIDSTAEGGLLPKN